MPLTYVDAVYLEIERACWLACEPTQYGDTVTAEDYRACVDMLEDACAWALRQADADEALLTYALEVEMQDTHIGLMVAQRIYASVPDLS